MEPSQAIPAHIAKNVCYLYKECLRRAEYVGDKHGNKEGIVRLVKYEFRKNMNERDPEKIQQLKEAAVKGLFNHMFHEAGQMACGKDDYAEP